jgi:hypothetical protein
MGEVKIKIKVPDGMEERIKKKIENLVKTELSKRKLVIDILRKYDGVVKGEINKEEWYLQ